MNNTNIENLLHNAGFVTEDELLDDPPLDKELYEEAFQQNKAAISAATKQPSANPTERKAMIDKAILKMRSDYHELCRQKAKSPLSN